MFDFRFTRTMKLACVEGAAYNAGFIITQSFIYTTLALFFHLSPLEMSIAAALPVSAQLMQLLTPIFYKFFKSRKQILVFTAYFGRLFLMLLPISIFFEHTKSYILLIALTVFSIFTNFTGNVWISAMKDIVPATVRPSFFSFRNTLIVFTGIIFTWIYTFLLQIPDRKAGLLIITSIAALFMLFTGFILQKHQIPDAQITKKTNINLLYAFKDKSFHSYLFFIGMWNFAIMFSAPFFGYFQVSLIKMDYRYLSTLTTITSILMMVLYLYFGKFSSKFGNKNALKLGTVISLSGPLFYTFMTAENYHILATADSMMTAFAWSAINLTMFNLLLQKAKEPSEVYVSAASLVGGLASISASIVGGITGEFLKDLSFTVSGSIFYGANIIFFIGFILRICAIIALAKVDVPEEDIKLKAMLNFNLLLLRKK